MTQLRQEHERAEEGLRAEAEKAQEEVRQARVWADALAADIRGLPVRSVKGTSLVPVRDLLRVAREHWGEQWDG